MLSFLEGRKEAISLLNVPLRASCARSSAAYLEPQLVPFLLLHKDTNITV